MLLKIDCARLPGKYLWGLLVVLLFPAFVFAQAKPVTGVVTDESGKPLSGVSVSLKNGNGGISTDNAGRFSLNAASGDVLIFSGVGFETAELPVGQRADLSISLKSKRDALNDVVVVGYATQKRSNLTGAVTTVSAKQLDDRPITNVSSALSGLMPGVSVMQGSGDPRNDGATIRVRGTGTMSSNNSPLVVVDGIIGVMDAVNPLDIESVTVLKDAASASIYGTLAANGVILITTKKGQKNKLIVNYSGNVSMTQPMRLPEFVTNYARHMRLMNEAHTNVSQAAPFTQATINAWDSASKIPNELNAIGVPNYIAYPNVDQAGELFSNRLLQNHTISINGGSDKVGYLVSIGYLNNEGTIANSGTKRYQFRANLDARVNKFLTLGTQTFGSVQNFKMGNTTSAFNFLRQSTPGIVPYWNGRYGFPQAPGESGTANNVLAFLNNTLGDDETTRFNTTLYATLHIIKGLSLESKVNYQVRQNETNSHNNPDVSLRYDFATDQLKTGLPSLANSTTYYSFDKNRQLTFDNVLRYNTQLGDHDLGALVGYNQLYYNLYNFNATKTGLIDYNLTTPSAVLTPTTINGGESDYAIRSWFGRVNYAYKGKYLLEGNLRYDGVSRFSPDTRWGLFPSVSAGWRISEENFMEYTRSWLSNLKLRASWGQLGNNASGNYDWQNGYVTRLYSFNNTQVAGLAVGSYANPDLLWETSTNTDLGIEGSVMNNKLFFELNFYKRVTSDILNVPPVSLTAGIASSPTVNGAEVTNKGIELNLGYRNKIGEFNFSVGGNVAYNVNEVTKFKGALKEGWAKDAGGNDVYQSNLGAVSTGAETRRVEGHKIDEHYLYQVYKGSGSYYNADGSVNVNGGPRDGMVRTTEDLDWAKAMIAAGHPLRPSNNVSKTAIWYGDLIYADLNGDGDYGNSFDRYFTGTSSLPKYVFGMNAELSWRQFDLSMIWTGAAGHKFYWNADNYNNSFATNGNAFATLYADDHYFYDPAAPDDARTNINAKYTRLKTSDPQNRGVTSDFWLYNAGWIKLKNLQVGYNLPEALTKKAFLQRARVYFSGENLLMITSFPGLDPETGSAVGYPTMRQYNFGVNLTF